MIPMCPILLLLLLVLCLLVHTSVDCKEDERRGEGGSSGRTKVEGEGEIQSATGGAESCGCSGELGSRSSISIGKGALRSGVGECDAGDAATVEEDASGASMVVLQGGKFDLGTDKPLIPSDGEGPVLQVTVSPFALDRFAVSNSDFRTFAEETGHSTDSEKYGWSFVFHLMLSEDQLDAIEIEVAGAPWWLPVEGSYWRHPEGPQSDVFADGREKHPATHISWHDADAFCKWRGARLPTEAEWEFAAAGETAGRLFPWGNVLQPGGEHRANIWQGQFPAVNTGEDGFAFTCPVDAYGPQNEHGLYNMVGNVWEWVSDWWTADRNAKGYSQRKNPRGPRRGTEKTKKGGSFLCHESYCYRYRVAARTKTDLESATSNQGFRCAKTIVRAAADE